MKDKILTTRLLAIAGLIFFAAFMRLIPHWPNFTPVAAIALFGGTYVKRRELAYLIPIIALFISDAIIGFHQNMLAVYISFVAIVFMGTFLRNKVKVHNVIGASLASSVLFFLVTNFAVWLTSPIYAANSGGLVASYFAGLPFFYNGLLGNLFYTGIIFGGFYLLSAKVPKLQKA
ncbi:MAG: hypothetical protein K9I94_01515 [Bacteroidales bacterium]|nr:hypothetical protein [Bacteroidales bacterium]